MNELVSFKYFAVAVIGIFYTCSTATTSFGEPVLGIVSVGDGAARRVVTEGLRVPLLVGGCRGQGAAVPRRRGAFDCICSMK